MENLYLWLLHYPTAETMVIRLTNEERAEAEKYDSFEDFICDILEPKYEFSLSDCEWMVSNTSKIERIGF